MSASQPPRILAIAGSDSSGGAGIQADIKTITMLGGYAMTAITAATAQNSVGVNAITPLSCDFVAMQIKACADDMGIDAIKIGMLFDADIVSKTADALAEIDAPIVLDPVMVATSGAELIDKDAIAVMRSRLFSRALVITPNLPELALLTGREPKTSVEMADSALELAREYGCHVLAKGGHTNDQRIVDVLVGPDAQDASRAIAFDHARIDSRHTHGTGCTLSSAIATLVGHGQPLEHAVRLARQFVVRAIEAAPRFGAGSGPLGHHAVRSID